MTETAEDAADNTQIPSPITDRASLDEVNEAIGSAIKRPADLELTDEAWATIDDEEKNPIGQYTFTYNGGTYTLRAAKDTGDISGVWENGTTLGNGREGDVTAITTENGGLYPAGLTATCSTRCTPRALPWTTTPPCATPWRNLIIINGPLRGIFPRAAAPLCYFVVETTGEVTYNRGNTVSLR